MKKKPIFTILITFIVIIVAYFIFWNIVTKKTKQSIAEEIKELGIVHEDISASGFPFSKNITISNLEFRNDVDYINQDVLKIEELKLSSFILGNKYKISFEDVTHFNSLKKEENKVVFNTDAKISVSFYKNGEVKSFAYKDTGYKIINPNDKELYSSGPSNIEIDSTLSDNSYDYSIQADFNEIKNFTVLDEKYTSKNSKTIIPDTYDFKIDASFFFKQKEEKIIEGSFKINELFLKNSVKDIKISLNGNLEFDEEDYKMFGDLKIQINNFDKFTKVLLGNLSEMQKENPSGNPTKDATEFKNFSNTLNNFKTLSKKNKESTNTKAVFLVEREKKGKDYLINNTSFLAFLEAQERQNKKEAERGKLKPQEEEMIEEKKE